MKVLEAIWNQVSEAIRTLFTHMWDLDPIQGVIIIALLVIVAVPALYINAAVQNLRETRKLKRNNQSIYG